MTELRVQLGSIVCFFLRLEALAAKDVVPVLHETLKDVKLRGQITAFLTQNHSSLADLFSNSVWLAHVAYLADGFEKLNTLNVSMQGRGHKFLNNMTKLMLSKKKISVWTYHVSKN